MKHLSLLVIALFALFAVPCVQAQPAGTSYPDRPVHLIVPFPAGGSSDTIMRMAGQVVAKDWAQPVIVENRGGATGAIAGEYVSRQPADGYTLLNATGTSHSALRALRRDMSYDPAVDFVPVTLLAIAPMMLVVNPTKVPVTDVKGLIAYLKANPGKVTYASTGIGSTAHLAIELFKMLTGTNMVHVPYRGNAPALTDLLAGNVDLTIDVSSSINAHVKSGALRAIAATTAKRTPFNPDLATVAETVPGFEAFSWNGIVVRTGTPPDAINKIQRDFSRAVQQPEIKKRLADNLIEAVGSTTADFRTLVEADQARWERVVKTLNIATERK
jgi:tripartite-type tricarboxylate transporter receptor subunit TctC